MAVRNTKRLKATTHQEQPPSFCYPSIFYL
nr:MAG TPA: hypothetical protein [Caudoviricetes sp.]